jgi:hypothetical protein
LANFGAMTILQAWKSRIELTLVFLFIAFSVFLLFRALNMIRKKNSASPYVLASLVLSYVFFFSIERGNTIILAAAFVGFFICYYDSENKNEKILAVISLALATSLKVYPILFGFLYFEKKQYREMFLSLFSTILLVFLPFLFFKRGLANIPKIISNIQLMTGEYSFTQSFPRFSLSHLFFNVFTKLKFADGIILSLAEFAKIVTILISFVSIVFSCLVRNKWLKISLLSLTLVFLPADSGWYCGLYMFPMIVLFFLTLEKRSKSLNVFTLFVFIVFLNPYQIVLNDGKSLNYIFANIALLTLWFVLLIFTGKELMGIKYERK